MKVIGIVFILLAIIMSCGQIPGKGARIADLGKRNKISKKKILEGEKNTIEPEKSEEKAINEIEKTFKEGIVTVKKEKVDSFITLDKRLRQLRDELKGARIKFMSQGHAFPDNLEGRVLIQGAINTGKYSFPNILKVIKDRGIDFERSGQIDEFYAGLGYDVGFITKLDAIISKLDRRGDRYDIAFKVIKNIGEIEHYKREVLNRHLGSSNLSKLKGKNNEIIAVINGFLDNFIEAKSNAIELIKKQIEVVANKTKEKDIYDELQEATHYNLEINRALGAVQQEYNKILNFSLKLDN
ncbi:hypothetical protein F0310_04320 (plasmid) [Borrelia sp. A-FGy1]|uniref:hypothetical protein n=1 Tax=Borrelia sp. A-FGy1 TaxID=2608247 RepID=UPI0015F376B1|nr:hypothetical protein [Borrelia sp. A-FGy1]QMU99643.1 hypothetical protein F0310_04320 [Borrelia sp. A-FGy1]